MKEFFPKFFHHFDVKDDDKYMVVIVRYQPDINEHGAVINSVQGFSNQEDASRACQLLNSLLRFARFEQSSCAIYEAKMVEKRKTLSLTGI